MRPSSFQLMARVGLAPGLGVPGPSPRVGDGVGDPQTRRCFFPSSAAPLRHRVLRLLWRIVLRSGSEKALQNQLCCGVAAAAGGEVR